MSELLHDLYYNQHNFDGANALYQKAKLLNSKITLKFVRNWLKNQTTHQLTTQQNIGKKQYHRIYSEDHNAYQIDLTFLNTYKSQNDGNYVLFTAINVNSRYAYAYYAKNKKAETILEMLRMFKEDVKNISTITCDLGSEFINNAAQNWFADNGIIVFFVLRDSRKLGIINRFHRTLKEKLLKYFTATNNFKWTHVLSKIIENYNNTVNRTIKMTPKEASEQVAQSYIISEMRNYNDGLQDKVSINVGDWVRLKNEKKLFEKMRLQYSPDIYQIVKVNKATVNVTNQSKDVVFKNIKKDQLIVVNNISEVDTSAHENILEEHRSSNRNAREEVDSSNIVPRRKR